MSRFWLPVLFVWPRLAAADSFQYVHFGDLGRSTCGAASSSWNAAELDDSAWTDTAGLPDAGTCQGTRFVRIRFNTGAELSRTLTLVLRVRYRHGVAAYLNGTEIARRR